MHWKASSWQLMKFGVAGALLTLLVSGLYAFAISFTVASPTLALTVATIIASIAGFKIHSGFSFRGVGTRDRPLVRFVRFLTTNAIGYLSNLAFVFIMVDLIHFPKWTPILAFSTVTPLISFALNRKWVFA